MQASRRLHRKSRYGCKECKKRHIKCDENRPACSNCSITKRACSFLGPSAVPTPLESSARSASPSSTTSATLTTTPPTDSGSQVPQPHVFTMQHLELLYHAEGDALRALGVTELQAMHTWRAVFEYALQAPYLMDQLLALSAAHLSLTRVDRRPAYQNEATLLQSRGLEPFKSIKVPEPPSTESVAVFLYSSLLGLHVLFDTLLCRDDFNTFMDQFSDYLSLHRGVRAVLPPGSFVYIQSQLHHFFGDLDYSSPSQDESHGDSKHECDPLVTLINEADMSPAATLACNQAVESLRWTYAMVRRDQTTNGCVNYVMAWPITIPSGFVNMIRQRRPEAMVILAYFAVLLDRSREFWVFGDGGRYIIQSISAHLGTFWDKWLAWPNEALHTESPRTPG